MQYSYFAIILFGLAVNSREIGVANKSKLRPRIVGGDEVTNLTQIPFQVSLQYRSRHTCGGSFLSRKWVLTAAHCTHGRLASDLSIRAGSLHHGKGGVLMKIEKIEAHPKYDFRNPDFDFSLLQLKSWTDDNFTCVPAKLPHQGEDVADGTILTVSGWGLTEDFNGLAVSLRVLEIIKVNQKKCRKKYHGYPLITDRMLCAGYSNGVKGAWIGDSGGPLTVNGTLVGVVSFGPKFVHPEYPTVFSRVSSVRDWIKSKTKL